MAFLQKKIDSIYNEIIENIDTASLNFLFEKALIYAELIKDHELIDWCTHEYNGYGKEIEVPEYRIIPVIPFTKEDIEANKHLYMRAQTVEELYYRANFPYRGAVKDFEDLAIQKAVPCITFLTNPFKVPGKKMLANAVEHDASEIKPYVDKLRQLFNKRILSLNKNNYQKINGDFLSDYGIVYKIYHVAIEKYYSNIFARNLLDDLRLSLELLLNIVLNNDKTLENQIDILGRYLKEKDSSTEIRNMLNRLLDYYTKYQNNYIKHNDSVKESEITLMVDLTTSFMKFLVHIDKEEKS